MRGCRYWRTRIPEAIYGELDPKTRGRMDRHLAVCPDCARLYEGMAGAVRRIEPRPSPARSPEFWAGYWDRLESRMAREAASAAAAPRRGLHRAAWAYGAAGAVLCIALGVFIGRTFFRPETGPAPLARTVSPEASLGGRPSPKDVSVEPALDSRASRYLRRSRTLLLAVINTDTRGDEPLRLSLPLQKKASEALLQEASVIKKELGRSDSRLERLVSDLELILLQIANLKPDPSVADIEIIKSGVENRDLIFKINLREARRSTGRSGDAGAKRSGGKDPGSAAVRMAAGA